MSTGIALLDLICDKYLEAVLVVLCIGLVLCLVRAIIGPKIADRLVAVNMTGTMVMVIVAVLGMKMNEGYLVDICLIYAMISFLAVIILSKVYLGVYQEQKAKGAKKASLELNVEDASDKNTIEVAAAKEQAEDSTSAIAASSAVVGAVQASEGKEED